MEFINIDQPSGTIGVGYPTNTGKVALAQDDQAIFIDRQSIPDLIEALKKHLPCQP